MDQTALCSAPMVGVVDAAVIGCHVFRGGPNSNVRSPGSVRPRAPTDIMQITHGMDLKNIDE